jgi:hypothetical protein
MMNDHFFHMLDHVAGAEHGLATVSVAQERAATGHLFEQPHAVTDSSGEFCVAGATCMMNNNVVCFTSRLRRPTEKFLGECKTTYIQYRH